MDKFGSVFCVGLLVLQMYSAVMAQNSAEVKNQCVVNICKVESNLSTFLGQEVLVKGTYKVGFEMGWLEANPSCELNERHEKFFYVFDSNFEKFTKKKLLSRFKKLTKWDNSNGNAIRAVSGLFKIRVESYKKNVGRDNRFDFQIVIVELISIDQ
jgi:hypothetical protein